jgi:hypothetical protein
VVPASQTVKISSPDGAWVRLRLTVSYSSAVPIRINKGGTDVGSSALMTGTRVVTSLQFAINPQTTVAKSIATNVIVNGSKKVTVVGPPQAVFVYALNQTIVGTARVDLIVDLGSASFVTNSYLPTVAKTDYYFFDDFSEDRGWQNFKCEGGCDCEMELTGGTLQVTLNDTFQRCFVAPPGSVHLAQGNFSVRARKRNDNFTWYGLIFNASTDLLNQRWALEARPSGGDPCDSDKGLLWLSYMTDGSDSGDLWDLCTSSLDLDTDAWNTLNVVRNGSSVQAYINGGTPKFEKSSSNLKDEPFFDLEVMSADEVPVVVQFDDFLLRY